MKPLAPDYKRALYWALGLHLCLLIAMLLQLDLDFFWEDEQPSITFIMEYEQIVQAHTVPQAALDLQNKKIADVKRKKEEELRRIAQEKKKKEEAIRLAALEKKRQAEEKAKAEAEAKAKVEAEAKAKAEAEAKAKAEAARLAELEKQKQAQAEAETAMQEQALQDQLLLEQQAVAAQQAQSAAVLTEVQRYTLLVKQKVMQNWLVQRGFEGLSTELHVRVAPGGTVLDVQIVKKSGNEALDRSAVSAVHRASPLPVPSDPAAFESFREIRLILKPEEVLG